MTMAAYIDLNPIRAGMVEKPEAYRWSGYAEATGGRRMAQSALRVVVETHQRVPMTLETALAKYRELLYGAGEKMSTGQNSEPGRQGMTLSRLSGEAFAKPPPWYARPACGKRDRRSPSRSRG